MRQRLVSVPAVGRRGGWALALVMLAACAAPSAGPASARMPTATADPTPHATPPPIMDYRLALIDRRIAHMTLDQELGQLFIVEYLYPDANHADLQDMITTMGAGGVILYHYMNIFTIPQMQALTSAMQAHAAIPLVLGADEEGGGDDQIDQIFGPHPIAWDIGLTGDPSVAAQNATRIAGELKQLGLNTDFAPVVDVESPQRAWTRAFSRSPDVVSRMGAAQVDAYQSHGVLACPKHFPGLGAAIINPHQGLPEIDSSRAYLEQNDFAPYRALMSHHPAMIMTTDVLMPALDSTMPAELSRPIVTGILRDEIGYQGVIVTDALYMGGITDRFTMAQAGVLAVQAGNDMLEGPWNADQMRIMVNALRAAVRSGQLSRARIDQSVRRILLMKLRFGLLRLPPTAGQHDVGLAPLPGAPAAAAFAPDQALVPDPRRWALVANG
jgi:beta-N-acetylhexosaminidase